jgi:hypothetical protein
MISLVLSPNSAGGAPVTTSIVCTIEVEIWLEKIFAC